MKRILIPISMLGLCFVTFGFEDGNGDGNAAAKPTDVTDVVSAANALKAVLTAAQVNTLQQPFSSTLAEKWSNLPCGSGCRNGIQLSSLSGVQLSYVDAVINAAAGTTANEGSDEFAQIRKADDYLASIGGGSGYSAGIYFLSFLNEPSTTGAWLLQYGGHHYAGNIAYNGGKVVGTTPFFEGVEPLSFTVAGTTYTPLDQEHNNITAMLASLSASEFAAAKLTSTFSDVVLGPNQDGNFPATKVGVKVGNLTTAQKNLVLEAMKPWLQDADDESAATMLSIYEDELDDTYIAFTGNATVGSAGSFLNANTNYARIDGPSVWIEFVCQSGVVVQGQIHYHTVWRDHKRDYGNYLTNTSLELGSTNIADNANKNSGSISLYPNPAGASITLSMASVLKNATIDIYDFAGKRMCRLQSITGSTFSINIASLPAGVYNLSIESEGNVSHKKFIKQ